VTALTGLAMSVVGLAAPAAAAPGVAVAPAANAAGAVAGMLPTETIIPDTLPPAGSTGSLTVHLFTKDGSSSITGDDGTQTGLMRGINGVTVTITPVGGTLVDLSTDLGWQRATALINAFNPDAPGTWGWSSIDFDPAAGVQPLTLGVPQSKVSSGAGGLGNAGLAEFTGVPMGLYLVTESNMPPGVTGAKPFLITVPFPTVPTGGAEPTWDYTVDVFPKGAEVTVDKTVDTSGAHTLGDTVTYTISTGIPNTPALDTYIVRDVSTTDEGNIAVLFPTLAVRLSPDGTAAGSLLTEGVDYDIIKAEFNASGIALAPAQSVCTTTGTDQGFGYFNIVFNETGRGRLLDAVAANSNARVVISYGATITTGVSGDPDQVDAMTNRAQLYVSTAERLSCTPRSDDATFEVGVAALDKFAAERLVNITRNRTGNVDVSGALLTGATFKVYATLADAQARNDKTVPIMMTTATGRKPVDPATDGRTMVEGAATCDGTLSPQKGTGVYLTGELVYGNYWVVEVGAPTGYALDSTPIPITVSKDTSWSVQAPVSDSCDSNGDGTPDASGNKPIKITPVYNVNTNTWNAAEDWAVARVINARTTTTPSSNPPGGGGGGGGPLAFTGVPDWLGAVIITAIALLIGGLIFVGASRHTERRRRREEGLTARAS
jgi:hypothetical protein